ncbi:hypothetical protein P9112_010092 [Eukaryota sp. TZLM1-RC]
MSKSLGSAEGTLSFRLGTVTQLVHVKHSLPIIPGNNMLLIGRDLLHHLGLLNDEDLFIKMDEEHRTLLLPEAEFDHRISIVSDVVNVPRRWLEHIQFSGCTINLDYPSFSKYLYDLDVAINKIAPEIWCQCFPDSVQDNPPRNLVNLRNCVKKL